MNKYRYLKVIQGNFGGGWEDLASYEGPEVADIKRDLKEYKLAAPEYPHRIVSRRVWNKKNA